MNPESLKRDDGQRQEKSTHAKRVNHLLTIFASIEDMLVSHRYKFVLFPDPLGSCPWIARALHPWLDQPIASDRSKSAETTLFNDMSPAEAELSFDMMGIPFHEYTRIAIIRNPYAKMAQLYYRISITDPAWRMRQHVGLELPQFGRWLRSTRTNGVGAGYRTSARWRKFGAWSAEAWCGDQITHTVRANNAADELAPIFAEIGISPAFGDRNIHELGGRRLARLYNAETNELIRERYQSDLRLYRDEPAQLRLVSNRPARQVLPRYRSVA